MPPIQRVECLRHALVTAFAHRWAARVSGLIVLVFALIAPSAASAAPYVFAGTQATHFVHYKKTLTAGSHTFRTTNLTSGCNPFMHVFRESTGTEVAHNDDFPGAGLNSQVTFTAVAGDYTVIVRKSSGSPCRGDVQLDGVTLFTQALFGGTVVPVTVTGTITYETVLTAQGSTDTYIVGLNGSDAVVAKDDESGVGAASRFISSSTTKVVVGSYSESSAGPTTLYLNKPSVDADLDGLGDGIETELGTCRTPTCTLFSGQTTKGPDTDHDGLGDYIEVFGMESSTGGAPMYLPLWGGSPKHKDLFVELDYSNEFSSTPFTATDAAVVRAIFAGGTNADLLNPDGVGGIATHLDIGVPSNPGETWYGAYGGTSQAHGTSAAVAYANQADFDASRRGIFHYALMYRGSGGQSNAIPGVYLGWGGNESNRNLHGGLVHELGHHLGLDHHGHNSWGKANCKPTYKSLMNYAFEYNDAIGFSGGQLATYITNPSKVAEGGVFPSGVDISYLSQAPFNFATNVNPNLVDWNRDLLLDPGPTLERASVNWANGAGCAALTGAPQDVSSLDEYKPDAPKLVKAFGHMYAFYVDNFGTMQYQHGPIGGVDAKGSCQTELSCVIWSDPIAVAAAGEVSGLSITRWKTGVLLAYRRATDGSLYSKYATTTNAAGDITNWSGDLFVNMTDVAPEATSIYMNDAGGVFTEVGVIFGSTTGFYYMATSSNMGTAFSTNFVQTSGSALTGGISPTLIRWPNRGGIDHSAIETLCGVFPDTSNYDRFYCFSKSAGIWTDITSVIYQETGIPNSFMKIGLAYHIPRRNTGAPLNADTTFGQFYMTAVDWGGTPVMFMGRGTVSPPGTSQVVFSRVGKFWDDFQTASTGVTLYEDESISAPKAIALWNGPAPLKRLLFHGLADGTVNVDLKDGNDWQVMERGICLGPQGGSTGYCGATNKFGY